MFLTFTPEELEELRRFDAEIDAAPMEYEDYLISDFVEALLFPDRERRRAQRREHDRRTYEREAEKRRQYQREYRAAHKEGEAAKRHAYYEANRERILAQQREYRRRKAEAREAEREARRATARERKRAYDREYQRRRREAAAQSAGGLRAPVLSSTKIQLQYEKFNYFKPRCKPGKRRKPFIFNRLRDFAKR